MSSMTDLVFLLLIFFIITSTMVVPNAIKVVLPSGKTQVKVEDTKIEIAIDKDNQVYVSGEKSEFDRLRFDIEQELKDKDPAHVTLALSPDKSVPTEYLVKALTVANEMKLKMIIRTRN